MGDEHELESDIEFARSLKKLKEKELGNKGIQAVDKLDQIFMHQAAFQNRLGIEPYKFDQQYITTMTLAAICELTEFIEWTEWKPWKTKKEIHIVEAKIELIDVLHFIVNLMMAMGMTSQEVFDLYIAKNKENFARQDRGY